MCSALSCISGYESVGVIISGARRRRADIEEAKSEGAVFDRKGRFRRIDASQLDFGFGLPRARLILRILRDRDGDENADDGNDDHQLDEREALFVFFESSSYVLLSKLHGAWNALCLITLYHSFKD